MQGDDLDEGANPFQEEEIDTSPYHVDDTPLPEDIHDPPSAYNHIGDDDNNLPAVSQSSQSARRVSSESAERPPKDSIQVSQGGHLLEARFLVSFCSEVERVNVRWVVKNNQERRNPCSLRKNEEGGHEQRGASCSAPLSSWARHLIKGDKGEVHLYYKSS